VTSTVHFSKGRQLLVDFQLIPTPSLDFQVALNLGEPAPLIFAIALEITQDHVLDIIVHRILLNTN